MKSPLNTNTILNMYGGEFTDMKKPSLLPNSFVQQLQTSGAPLCYTINEKYHILCKIVVVASESWVANSQCTASGDWLIILSVGVIARLKQFLDLAMLYDGKMPHIVFVHAEPSEQFEEWNDPPPKMLQPILQDYSEPSAFWTARSATQARIDELYKLHSREPSEAIWQIVLLSCIHLVAHEACHLIDQHACFLDHLAKSQSPSMHPSRARVGVELVADGYATRMLMNGIYGHCKPESPDLFIALFSFWLYGVSSLYLLWDAQQAILKSANRDGTDNSPAYPHPYYRCQIINDCAIEFARSTCPSLIDRLVYTANATSFELANNMACIIEHLVIAGELDSAQAMRFPCINQYANSSRFSMMWGAITAEEGYKRLLDTWSEFNIHHSKYVNDNSKL